MNEYTEFDTAAEMQKALDRKKAAYGRFTDADGNDAPVIVDEDGIIQDVDFTNIAKDERSSSVWNNFAPTDSQIAALILAVLLALSLGIDQAMKGDLAAVRGMALADVEASVGSER